MMPKIAKAQEAMEKNGKKWKRMEEKRISKLGDAYLVLAFSSGSGLAQKCTAKLRKPQKIQKILEGFARG